MARPTRLRVLEERPVEPEDDGTVVDMVPPAQVAIGTQAADDILAVLRKSHERMEGQVSQAAAVARAAIERADAAMLRISTTETTIAERGAEVERNVQKIAERASKEISSAVDRGAAAKQVTAAAFAVSAGMLRALATYLVDRAPALLSLGAAVWLWNSVLGDPKPLQLIGLGLFGAVVIAPSVWLSSRRG